MKSTKPTSNEAENGNKSKPLLSSRLFKFRVWAENNEFPKGQMYLDKFLLNLNGDLIFPNRINAFDYSMSFARISFNNINLMQFTGLIDKNSKEIYEGDIVFNHAENGVCNSNIIIFNEYGYFLQTYFSNARREIISLDEYLTRDLEVIGNIFENPELL
jgi:uncharacterized phage protein (TIGR01671 family)